MQQRRLDPSQWKSARTTNAIERLNEEFRRRIKTQTVLPCAETVPMLLWALLASGQIQMRKVDGWEPELPRAGHQRLPRADGRDRARARRHRRPPLEEPISPASGITSLGQIYDTHMQRSTQGAFIQTKPIC